MKCGSCGAEANGKFCRHCGSPVKKDHESHAISIKSDSIEVAAIQVAPQVVSQAPSKLYLNAFLVSSVTAGIVLTLIVAGLAFGLNWLAKQGEFQEDLMFHVLSNVVNIPPEQAAYFISQLKSGAWLQLMLLHGGTIEGTYYIEKINELISNAPIQLGMILLLNAALGFVLIAIVSRAIYYVYSKRKKSKLLQLLWVIALSTIYSLAMTSMLAFFAPNVKFAFGDMEYILEFHVQFLQLLLVTFSFSLCASIVGTGGWTAGLKLDLSQWVKSIGRFAVTLILFFVVIFVLMTLNWSTAKQSELHSTEVITMGAVWDAYKHDPGVYGIIPNVMMQQFIYSLGGTWHVSNQSAADLLGIKQPVQLNLLSGATSTYEESDPHIERFQKELRFHWFHVAFVVVFFFALSRIQFVKLWSYAATVLIIIITTTFAAIGFNVKIAAGEVEQALIGYEFRSTIIQIGIVVALFLIVSYGLQYVLTKRRTTNEQ